MTEADGEPAFAVLTTATGIKTVVGDAPALVTTETIVLIAEGRGVEMVVAPGEFGVGDVSGSMPGTTVGEGGETLLDETGVEGVDADDAGPAAGAATLVPKPMRLRSESKTE